MGLNLEIDLDKVLSAYAKEVKGNLEKSVQETAKETVEILKSTSPKDTGKYASGWTIKQDTSLGVKTNVIYNAKQPGLTHLLEFGHSISNQHGATGKRTVARPHVEPASREAIRIFQEKVNKNIGGGK